MRVENNRHTEFWQIGHISLQNLPWTKARELNSYIAENLPRVITNYGILRFTEDNKILFIYYPHVNSEEERHLFPSETDLKGWLTSQKIDIWKIKDHRQTEIKYIYWKRIWARWHEFDSQKKLNDHLAVENGDIWSVINARTGEQYATHRVKKGWWITGQYYDYEKVEIENLIYVAHGMRLGTIKEKSEIEEVIEEDESTQLIDLKQEKNQKEVCWSLAHLGLLIFAVGKTYQLITDAGNQSFLPSLDLPEFLSTSSRLLTNAAVSYSIYSIGNNKQVNSNKFALPYMFASFLPTASADALTGSTYFPNGDNVLKVGSEFLVNDGAVLYCAENSAPQTNPSISATLSGGFVVGWLNSRSNCQRPYVSIFNADTKYVGYGWATGMQSQKTNLPVAISLENNNIVLSYIGTYWTDVEIYILNSEGGRIDGPWPVEYEYYGTAPSLGKLPGGGFFVSWQGNDVNGNGIYAKAWDPSFKEQGLQFQVNTYTAGDQKNPVSVGLRDGSMVFAWQSAGQDGSGNGVYGQAFADYRTQIGKEYRINSYVTNDQINPASTVLPNGELVTVWQSYFQDGSGWGIYGRRHFANGTMVAPEFQVNSYVNGDQMNPAVASLAQGFVVVWESSGPNAVGKDIFGQVFNLRNAKTSAEFRVNTYTRDDQQAPKVTGLVSGDFVVVWQSYLQYNTQSSWDIYGQRFQVVIEPPVLTANQFTINKGQRLTALKANFLAVDSNTDADLTYTITGMQHMRLEKTNSPGVAINSFSQQEINQLEISLRHDGSDSAPAYQTSVSNGIKASSPASATIHFSPTNKAPTLAQNSLVIKEGQRVTLNSGDLQATDLDNLAAQLILTPSKVQFGRFETTAQVPIASFIQQQITDGQIQFIHDGSEHAPSYEITVSDSTANSQPSSANISYSRVNHPPRFTALRVTIRQGESITLTTNNINVQDDGLLQPVLLTVYTVQHSKFALTSSPGVSIMSFVFNQILNNSVLYTHDNSEEAPSFSLTAYDGEFTVGPQSANITYINVNNPPVVIKKIPDKIVVIDKPFGFEISPSEFFADPDHDPLTLSASQANGSSLPSWLDFSDNKFSGLAREIGFFKLNVTATDPSNASVSTSFGLSATVAEDTPTNECHNVSCYWKEITGGAAGTLLIGVAGFFFKKCLSNKSEDNKSCCGCECNCDCSQWFGCGNSYNKI